MVSVAIEHEFENTSFSVSVIPTANPNGTVGDIWCVKTNKTVTVYFGSRLRDIQRFDSPDELKKQIYEDIRR